MVLCVELQLVKVNDLCIFVSAMSEWEVPRAAKWYYCIDVRTSYLSE